MVQPTGTGPGDNRLPEEPASNPSNNPVSTVGSGVISSLGGVLGSVVHSVAAIGYGVVSGISTPISNYLEQRKLESLRCWVNKKTNLNLKNVDELLRLTELDLSNKKLSELPAEIGKLTNLTSLNVSGNWLTTLPAEIGKLINLASLNVSGNRLTTLPAEIGKLTNLTSLDVAASQLTALPAEIGKLKNLTSLDVAGNQLRTLPAEIGNLTSLKSLILFNNQLTTLPPEIGKLINLISFEPSYNWLTTLPPEIGKLINLISFDLCSNELTTLPAEIGNLTNLKNIDLRVNQLRTLPAEIGNLTNLKDLDLYSNELTTLPAEIGNLTNLTRLDLSSNQLTVLPLSLANLSSNCTIDAQNNRMSEAAVIQFQEEVQRVRQADSTRGPRFECSIYEEPISNADSLNKVLKDWIQEFKKSLPQEQAIGEEACVAFFTDERKCSANQQDLLQQFLKAVRQTEDFKNGGISKQKVVLRCYQMIKHAMENNDFRENLFPLLRDALGTCGDRVTIYFNFIEMEWYLSQKDITTKKLAEILIGLNRVDRLLALADERAKKMGLGDHIEVQLLYQIKLKDRLKLPISTEGMLYGGTVRSITDKMLDEDAKKVLDTTTTKEQITDILLHYDKWGPKWEEKIKSTYKKEFEALNEKMSDKIEEIDKKLPTNEYKRQVDLITAEEKIQSNQLIESLTQKWVEENWS